MLECWGCTHLYFICLSIYLRAGSHQNTPLSVLTHNLTFLLPSLQLLAFELAALYRKELFLVLHKDEDLLRFQTTSLPMVVFSLQLKQDV